MKPNKTFYLQGASHMHEFLFVDCITLNELKRRAAGAGQQGSYDSLHLKEEGQVQIIRDCI